MSLMEGLEKIFDHAEYLQTLRLISYDDMNLEMAIKVAPYTHPDIALCIVGRYRLRVDIRKVFAKKVPFYTYEFQTILPGELAEYRGSLPHFGSAMLVSMMQGEFSNLSLPVRARFIAFMKRTHVCKDLRKLLCTFLLNLEVDNIFLWRLGHQNNEKKIYKFRSLQMMHWFFWRRFGGKRPSFAYGYIKCTLENMIKHCPDACLYYAQKYPRVFYKQYCTSDNDPLLFIKTYPMIDKKELQRLKVIPPPLEDANY